MGNWCEQVCFDVWKCVYQEVQTRFALACRRCPTAPERVLINDQQEAQAVIEPIHSSHPPALRTNENFNGVLMCVTPPACSVGKSMRLKLSCSYKKKMTFFVIFFLFLVDVWLKITDAHVDQVWECTYAIQILQNINRINKTSLFFDKNRLWTAWLGY